MWDTSRVNKHPLISENIQRRNSHDDVCTRPIVQLFFKTLFNKHHTVGLCHYSQFSLCSQCMLYMRLPSVARIMRQQRQGKTIDETYPQQSAQYACRSTRSRTGPQIIPSQGTRKNTIELQQTYQTKLKKRNGNIMSIPLEPPYRFRSTMTLGPTHGMCL